MRATVNAHHDPRRVPAPSGEAFGFHAGLPGYAPTPVRLLPDVASSLDVAAVGVKDESVRLGLPAFKVLGVSWAVQRTLDDHPDVRVLVAASAGNHGRAVAHVAAQRGLAARVFLPARAALARREAIADEGADVVVVDGDYEDAVRLARDEGRRPGAAEIADVGDSDTAHWVIDGYATLFAELRDPWDVVLAPTGVGSLTAAAARHVAATGAAVVGVEPGTAACLAASLEAGEPTAVPTPGTTMAGLDCAEVSPAAWPTLLSGVLGTVAVTDREARAAMRELHARGLSIGESGAASLAGLRVVAMDPECCELRNALGFGRSSRVLLLATEGITDPQASA